MAFPNVTDLVTTTLEQRSGEIADNITGNNALLFVLKGQGKVQPVSGGRVIYEELSFAENSNAGWYSGYDTLPTGAADVLSAAEFSWKQAACPVVFSGLETDIQNAGKEQLIDLVAARIDVAKGTIANLISAGLYSDGTGAGGKQITGLLAAVPVDPTTGVYGNINSANYPFWQSYAQDTGAAPSASTIQAKFTLAWANLVRGKDKPNLITADDDVWTAYMASLQANQRFTDAKLAEAGFENVKFMSAPVVLDSGIGGDHTDVTAFFLNTKYLKFRPHSKRNMVPLDDGRAPFNQDVRAKILAWAGNMTCSFRRAQGQIVFS